MCTVIPSLSLGNNVFSIIALLSNYTLLDHIECNYAYSKNLLMFLLLPVSWIVSEKISTWLWQMKTI